MSDPRIELARELFHEWHHTGTLPGQDHFAADFELHTPFSDSQGAVYRGPSGMHDWAHDINERLQGFFFEPTEFTLHGDRILALGRIEHEGSGSAAGLVTEAACLIDVVDGKFKRIELYSDRQAALAKLA